MKNEPGTTFLCAKHEIPQLMQDAQKECEKALQDLMCFCRGNIGISLRPQEHIVGYSIVGELTVNGEVCRTYDPVDLCLLDINEMVLKMPIKSGVAP